MSAKNLGEQLATRDAFLANLVETLKADDRFVAAWLTGSLSQGKADALSDLDLQVVVAAPHVEALCARPQAVSAQTTPDRMALFSRFGAPVMVHENNYNAPEDGTFTNVVYAETNVMVDWILRPQANAERPTTALLLFDKVGVAVSENAQPESLAQRAEMASEKVAFFWMMTAVTVKYSLRGDGVFATIWLEELHRMVREVERLIAGRPYAYQGRSVSTLAASQPEQLAAVEALTKQMEGLLPQVAALGGYVRPSPRATLLQMMLLKN